ncbi:MAG: histidinol-phosphatase [Calditrichales bacterium]|nr:MAG: histidinol-phosphatase [Calditrichales bacterium]
MHDLLHEYVGVIHVHSTYSDGSRPIPEIAQIASEVSLDYLMFTDHNTLQPKRDGMEGWYRGVLISTGYEINDADDLNHYLTFGLDTELPQSLDPAGYVSEVDRRGGFGIIAHPDEKRNAIKEYPANPWTVWDSDKYHGIEIWNQMSEWMEGLTHLNKYWRVLHPRRSVIVPLPETLEKWDRANRNRKVVGIGGVDAHGHLYKLWGLFQITIFRYKVLFKTIRTHILTDTAFAGEGDHHKDLQNLYKSLRECRCFISNYYCGDARGFRFQAENKTEKVEVGGQLKFDKYTHIHVNLPQTAVVHLIRDGKKIAVQKGDSLVYDIQEKGCYRVEAYYFDRPWIFSNHIRII